MAVFAFVSFGGYGCAKKQVASGGGEQMETQKPAVPEEKPATETERTTTEAPPGPKEQPEPTEKARAEKALKDAYFDFDSFQIKPEAASVLQANAKWIKDNPGNVVTVEGHCDERGTVEYNLALGEKRADAARDYLVSLGVDASRLKTISYGKSKPADPGHTEEAWSKNRRAHFVVQ